MESHAYHGFVLALRWYCVDFLISVTIPDWTKMSTPEPKNIVGLYWKIFWILMVLLVATVWVAYLDLGRLALLIAMIIAVAKATLVVLYFMHARYSSKAIWIWASAGFVWLLMGLIIFISDYLTRSTFHVGSSTYFWILAITSFSSFAWPAGDTSRWIHAMRPARSTINVCLFGISNPFAP